MAGITHSSFQEMQRLRAQLRAINEARPDPKLHSRRELRPGSRFFAKWLDIFLLGSPFWLVALVTAMTSFTEHSTGFAAAGLLPIALILFPFVEATILALFGTTPGKALFRLAIRNSEGKKPNFGKLLARSYLCWFFGLGMGIPYVHLISMSCSRRHLERHGIAGWDRRTGLVLIPQEMTATREVITMVITPLLPPVAGSVIILGLEMMVGKSDGADQSNSRSAAYYRQACDGGEALGCFNLGVSYATGEGVALDVSKAAVLFRKACDGGDAGGCAGLGNLLYLGLGIAPNKLEGARLLRQACQAENEWACGRVVEHGLDR